jgi:peroxiredoxin
MLRLWVFCFEQLLPLVIKGAISSIFVILVGCSSADSPIVAHSALDDQKMAPNFALPKISGGWHSLTDFRGRTLILHFWSPWCVTCGPELQSLQVLHYQQRDKIAVLAVSVGATFDDVKKFALVNHLSLPIVVEEEERSASKLYDVGLLPISFVINKSGKLVAIKDYQTGSSSQRIEGVRHWTMPSLVRELLSVN